MGYGTRGGNCGHTIRTFQPDDTDRCFYLGLGGYGISLASILERAQEKWPGIKMDEIEIDSEYIQTDCLGYDRYDPSDYTNFVAVSASQDYLKRMKNKG